MEGFKEKHKVRDLLHRGLKEQGRAVRASGKPGNKGTEPTGFAQIAITKYHGLGA